MPSEDILVKRFYVDTKGRDRRINFDWRTPSPFAGEAERNYSYNAGLDPVDHVIILAKLRSKGQNEITIGLSVGARFKDSSGKLSEDDFSNAGLIKLTADKGFPDALSLPPAGKSIHKLGEEIVLGKNEHGKFILKVTLK